MKSNMLFDMFQDNCKPFLFNDFDYRLLRLPDLDYWSTADAYYSLAPDPNSGISSGPCLLHTHNFCDVILDYEIDYSSLSLPYHVNTFYTLRS